MSISYIDGDPLTEQGRNAFDQYYKDLRAWQKEADEAVVSVSKIPGAKHVIFDKWPNSLKDLAAEMAKLSQ